jgi:hypothetical protein
VQITQMEALNAPASCSGGGTLTLDLLLTVNFGSPSRWDVGIFLSNDGKDPQRTVANGGANSCSVAILPTTSPFLNLDSNGAPTRAATATARSAVARAAARSS